MAARLGKEAKLPLADSIIYATAKIHNSEIYTQDKHFDGLSGVHYFVKA
jgi:predicted nucleic acid-binding protein